MEDGENLEEEIEELHVRVGRQRSWAQIVTIVIHADNEKVGHHELFRLHTTEGAFVPMLTMFIHIDGTEIQ